MFSVTEETQQYNNLPFRIIRKGDADYFMTTTYNETEEPSFGACDEEASGLQDWSEQEENDLIELVKENGSDWTTTALKLETRSVRECQMKATELIFLMRREVLEMDYTFV